MTVIALAAAEASGDHLGAALMRAISQLQPAVRFVGVGGPKMRAAGLDAWWDCAELSVMGLSEVVRHLPRLLRLRRQLVGRLLSLRPDAFVGIDAPDFNLAVERKLKCEGIPVVHYVSPTVWAWRPGRVRTIDRSTDRVLCLFPFEPGCYEGLGVDADFTGHPLADRLDACPDSGSARAKLGIAAGGPVIAILPGSRLQEVNKLAPAMLAAAESVAAAHPGSRFLLAAASDKINDRLQRLSRMHAGLDVRILADASDTVMAAADLVICASGTATLEAMLINRPMVVCYRVSSLTGMLVRRLKLLRTRHVALPNILAQTALVPELLQRDMTAGRIAEEVSRWLNDPDRLQSLAAKFEDLRQELQTGAAVKAAEAVLQQVGTRPDARA
ncbi:MAG: lipid-A-disaccharide synthase [Lysobacterales bacterium]|jgi:lipid-A-disaccharide synthase